VALPAVGLLNMPTLRRVLNSREVEIEFLAGNERDEVEERRRFILKDGVTSALEQANRWSLIRDYRL
jgi:hypothetical protein